MSSLRPWNKLPDAYRYHECLDAIRKYGDPLRAGNNTHLIRFNGPVVEVLFYSKTIAVMSADKVELIFDDVPPTLTTTDRMNRVLAGYGATIWYEENRPATGPISIRGNTFYFGSHPVQHSMVVYGPPSEN